MMEYHLYTERTGFPSDISDDDIQILNQVKDYTMTSIERQLALIHAIRHIVRSGIPGCFAECGVWKGGSAMAAALTLMQEQDTRRHLYLFDTYEGMTEPTEIDRTCDGILAETHLEKMEKGTEWWCYSPLDEVKANLAKTGYPSDQVHFIKGPVEQTIPAHSPSEAIALLRLDTDWYESTRHELIHLFPLLQPGGILIIDDYGHWQGARKATDEYLASLPKKYYLHRIDYTGRLLMKEDQSVNNMSNDRDGKPILADDNQALVFQPNLNTEIEILHEADNHDSANYVVHPSDDSFPFMEGDYISPGLQKIKPDRCFPEMLLGNPADCLWPFLRREIPHNWYVDARYPAVGFINRDEVHILYNSALMFRGKRALEIGCWMGWSACHIALAGLELDVIDPMLEKPEFFGSVRDSLKRAGVLTSVRLIPGSSPEKVEEIAKREGRRWSFMFVDGNHESPHPLNDVRTCERYAEEDALVLFHDLVSPGVSEALDYMRKKGWNVMIYHTMQIMAVAWRGNVEPVLHQPDPRVRWQTPSHLKSFCSDLEQSHSEANPPREPLETMLDGMQSALDWLRLQLKASQEEAWQLQGEKGWFESELYQAKGKQAQLEQAQDELTQTQAQLEQAHTQIEQMNAQQSELQLKLQQNNGVVAYLRQQMIQAEQAQRIHVETEQKVQALQAELKQAQTRIAALEANLSAKQERLQRRKANLESKKSELDQALGRIAAMETSKFWKMRKLWFNIKRPLGLGGRE